MPAPSRSLPFALLAALLAAGCRPSYSPDTYSSGAVQQANKVEQGTIAGVRGVGVVASGATGAAAGVAAGGVLGSTVPGSSTQTALAAIGGGLVGGAVGAAVERATGDTTAFEYIVRKANGELLSVTQKDAKPLELGQKVLVITGNQARIVPDYTVPTEATSAAPNPPAVQATPLPAPPGTSLAAGVPATVPVPPGSGPVPEAIQPAVSPFVQRWRGTP